MLKTLIDLFLLLSNDKKSITRNDFSVFYLFIIKKLPEIDNQRPSLLISFFNKNNSQNSNNELFSKNQIDEFIAQNEKEKSKANKNITIKTIQNELLCLFNHMIDYLYEEEIIILSNAQKDILNNRINKKIKEKNFSFSKNNKSDIKLIQDIQIIEIRKYLTELISSNKSLNNLFSFDFSIKHFINFFNSKNKEKNRLIAEKFVNLINPIIKIYKADKIINRKKINQSQIKSSSRIPVINVYNNNLFKEKESKNKNLKISLTKNNYNYKINRSFNKNLKYKFNLNSIFANKRKTVVNKDKVEDKIEHKIEDKENTKDECNLTKDTIPCQTLNNCISFNSIQKNCIIENYLGKNIQNIYTNINNKNNKAISEKIAINNINTYFKITK